MRISKWRRREFAARAGAPALTLSLGAGLLLFNTEALSQALEEVIVTAQRVESTVQDTPIAIEAISGEQILDRGITTVDQLAQLSPSVNIAGDTGAIILTVRGVSSRDTTEIGDPAVTLSIDGFYQDTGQSFGLSQYDLERIEVLRGPQGTLYGRNATGGAVNLYTMRPQADFGGYGLMEVGNYGAVNAQGAVNIPLTDTVFMRASFGTQNHQPYREAPAGQGFGGFANAGSSSGRLQLRFLPSDSVDFRIAAQFTSQNALTNVPYLTPFNVLPLDTCAFASGPGPCQRVDHSMLMEPSDTQHYPTASDTFVTHDETALRWDLEWRMAATTLTYIGGWNQLDYSGKHPSWAFGSPGNLGTPVSQTAQAFTQNEDVETINQEIRFSSPDPSARFTYQAGVYYFKSENDLDSINQQQDGTATPPTNIHFVYNVPIESLSYMAHFAYDFTDELEFAVGFRNNSDKKDRTGNIFRAQFLPPGLDPVVSVGSDQDQSTYSVGLKWSLADSSMAYAKFDTGYKAGGFTDLTSYGPEEIESFEIGWKNRFLDDRLQLNLALYNADYTGQQVQQIVQGEGGSLRIENAGETSYTGFEADLLFATDNGLLSAGLSLLDAEFTDFILALQEPVWNVTTGSWATLPAVSADLAGNVPQQAPDVTFVAGYEHTFDVWGGELRAGFNAKYQSEQYFTFYNRPDDLQESYTTLNLLFSYTRPNAPWQVQLYGNNVTDEEVFNLGGPNDRSRAYSYAYQPPAVYGLRFRYDW